MKSKTLQNILLILLSVFSCGLKAQDYKHGTLWILLSEPTRVVGERETTDETLNRIFETYGVISIKQALPGAKSIENQRVFIIEYSGNDELLLDDLKNYSRLAVEDIYRIPQQPIALYEPNDEQWNSQYMWHLKKIQAEEAWDIQRGDENVVTAVIDTYFDPTHPDLQSEFLLNYPPDDTLETPLQS